MHHTIQHTLVEICARVDEKGFVAATDGNISVRLANGNILATPTSMKKGSVTIDDLVEVTLEGEQVGGRRKPSSEMPMHYFIYRSRPDVNAVVHCHPVYATGFAAARTPLPSNVFPEVIMQLGEIPLAPYATPSTEEMGDSLRPYIDRHDAILLANHGVVTCGRDLWDAYVKMEKVEQIAHMSFVAHLLGGAAPLSDSDVEKLLELTEAVHKK